MTNLNDPGVVSLFENLLFAADDLIKKDTAERMAHELGIPNFDVREFDH